MAMVTEQKRRSEKRKWELIAWAVAFLFGFFFLLHFGIVLRSFPDFDASQLEVLISQTIAHCRESPFSFWGGDIRPVYFYSIMMFALFVWYISSRKKLSPGKEHGTARWGLPGEAKRLMDKEFRNNILLTKTERLSMNARKIRKNLNILVIGDSGSGKSRTYVKPNLMQMHSSFVITDPKGELLRDTAKMLQDNGYEIKVFNLIEMDHSCCYCPFHYLEKEEDVMRVINCLIKNTTPENASQNDPFWEKSETALLQSLFFFTWKKLPKDEQNFSSVLELLRLASVDEENSQHKSDLDILMDIVRKDTPNDIILRQYDIFKQAAGKTAKSILISAGVRLAVFNIDAVANLTHKDTLELAELGEKKIALYILIPDSDTTFNFIAAMLYTQLFLLLSNIAFRSKGGRLKNHVRFILDEFANIGTIPDFDKQAATIRSKNYSVTVVLQHLKQLETHYKNSWEAIVNCCNTKLYLGGDEKGTTEYFSQMLGKETIDILTTNLSRGRQRSASLNYNKHGRELMMPDEIGKMSDQNCILMIKGVHPFFSEKFDITKHENYKLLGDPDDAPQNMFDFRSIKTPRRASEEESVTGADRLKRFGEKKEMDLKEVDIQAMQLTVGDFDELRYALEFEL